VPRLRRSLVFLDAIDALTRAAIACRVFDAKHILLDHPKEARAYSKYMKPKFARRQSARKKEAAISTRGNNKHWPRPTSEEVKLAKRAEKALLRISRDLAAGRINYTAGAKMKYLLDHPKEARAYGKYVKWRFAQKKRASTR
jgi:hypothetical protein